MSKSKNPEGHIVTTLSDNLILTRISAGDMASFDAVFHEHYDRVYGILFRLVGNRDEAENLTQEAFLKLYDHAFTKKRFNFKRENNIGGWLYRVATNMGYNEIRNRQRRWQRNLHLVPDPTDSISTETEVSRRETAVTVRKALSQLPERQVQLLVLRQMGMSYAECAGICNVAPGSVGTLLSRAAQAFKKAYQEEVDS